MTTIHSACPHIFSEDKILASNSEGLSLSTSSPDLIFTTDRSGHEALWGLLQSLACGRDLDHNVASVVLTLSSTKEKVMLYSTYRVGQINSILYSIVRKTFSKLNVFPGSIVKLRVRVRVKVKVKSKK